MAKIVLIDDEQRLLQTLARFLEREGHTALCGTDYAAVQEQLWPGRFDVLVTDIVMPTRTGLDVLQEVVGERGCREPVVLMTGQPSLESASCAVRAGAFDYISKPVTKEKLLEVVARAVRHVELVRERDRARAAELQVLRNLAALGESASVISHELRTPVTSLRHALRAVGSRIGVEDRVLVEELVAGIDKIERVLGQTLSFARPLRLDLAAVDVPDLCRAVMTEVGRLPIAGGMTFQLRDGVGLPAVRADAGLLQGVIANLLRNAAEACQGKGAVDIELSADDDQVVIEVVDDGPGVPRDRRTEIFQPFQSSKEYGTGLGLAHCRKVVESHGGTLGLVDRPGAGACFRIRLPVSGPAPVPAQSPPANDIT